MLYPGELPLLRVNVMTVDAETPLRHRYTVLLLFTGDEVIGASRRVRLYHN